MLFYKQRYCSRFSNKKGKHFSECNRGGDFNTNNGALFGTEKYFFMKKFTVKIKKNGMVRYGHVVQLLISSYN